MEEGREIHRAGRGGTGREINREITPSVQQQMVREGGEEEGGRPTSTRRSTRLYTSGTAEGGTGSHTLPSTPPPSTHIPPPHYQGPAYTSGTAEGGTGSHARRKAIMEGHVDRNRTTMFTTAIRPVITVGGREDGVAAQGNHGARAPWTAATAPLQALTSPPFSIPPTSNPSPGPG